MRTDDEKHQLLAPLLRATTPVTRTTWPQRALQQHSTQAHSENVLIGNRLTLTKLEAGCTCQWTGRRHCLHFGLTLPRQDT